MWLNHTSEGPFAAWVKLRMIGKNGAMTFDEPVSDKQKNGEVCWLSLRADCQVRSATGFSSYRKSLLTGISKYVHWYNNVKCVKEKKYEPNS